MKNELPKIRRTALSNVEKNRAIGIMCIVIGIIVTIVSIPMIPIFIGIFSLIGGLGVLGYGASQLSGTQKGTCPYCNNAVTVHAKAATFKCPLCKKVSTRTADSLESIE